jgi:ABC-2 type transport system permease protein
MIRASLYIVVCSARNRVRVRLRRLREPRYLIGAAVAIAYLYFTIFVRIRSGGTAAGRRRRRAEGAPASASVIAALQASGVGLAGLALLALAALAWVFPGGSGLLQFSPAETDLLMPAPVTRRQLLLHRMIRSQIGLLFASFLPVIWFPSASAPARARIAVALWVVFVTAKIYFTGVTLTRARLMSEGRRAEWGAWAPAALIAGAAALVVFSIAHTLNPDAINGPEDLLRQVGGVMTGGAVGVAMFPLLALVRPLFAPWPWPFLAALVPAVLVLAATIVWVLQADAAVDDAVWTISGGATATPVGTVQVPAARARDALWTLAPRGRAEGLFLWKNMVQMVRATTGAALIRYIAPAVVVTVMVATMLMSGNRASGTAKTLCSLAVALAGFSVLLGPQVVRVDLRDDLRHLELLKTWPVESAAVIRGEMLCPGAVLTSVAWLAMVCASILSAAGFPRLSLAWRVSGSIAAALLAPALIFAQLTVHNASAVLFPAWVPIGHSRPRGLDAMGQRLILFGAVALTLAFMMIPGVLISAVLWLVLEPFVGAAVLIPCALACLVIVAIEVIAATEVLGPAYERMDLLAAERAE